MQPDKLVMMANQIAAFFAAQGEARAVPRIADHIAKFWDPRMRQTIAAHIQDGGAGLSPLAKAALDHFQQPTNNCARNRTARNGSPLR